MPVSISRQIAFEVLRRVEAEGAYASDVLHTEFLGRRPFSRTDAALATGAHDGAYLQLAAAASISCWSVR